MTTHRRSLRLGAAAILAPVAGALLLPGSAAAQGEPEPAPADPAVTAESAQAFLDARLPELLAEHRSTGVAAGVVQGGEQIASGGHGHADAATGEPIASDDHVFPVASVAKSFTAMAVLQLAERGEMDLHEDINAYLPETVQVEDTYPGEPVTLHHVLTHTAGFEEFAAGKAVRDPADLPSLEEQLAGFQVERLRAPGRLAGYSNYGVDLAGLAVEEVSGLSFSEYTETNIFAPLGMDDTAFAPVHEARAEYEVPVFHEADQSPAPDLHIGAAPSGGAVATVPDMGRFMSVLLEGGELHGERVLSAESVASMLDRQVENDPGMTGLGYGTYEIRRDAPRVVGHHGDLLGAHTGYVLVPELDTGIYVAVNGEDGAAGESLLDLRMALLEEFVAEFAPAEAAPAEGRADPEADLDRYTGTYLTTRINDSEPVRFLTVTDSMSVRAADDGALEISGPSAADERWLPVEGNGNLFGAENGQDRIAFLEENDQVVALALDSDPSQAYEPVRWYESPGLHLAIAAAAALLLLTVLVWPAAALVRLIRGRKHGAPTGAVLSRAAAGLAALACFTAVGVILYGLADPNTLLIWLFTGSPLLTAPMAFAAIAAIATLAAAVAAWMRGWWSTAGRAHYTLVALAATVFVSFGAAYHMMWLPPA